MKGRTICISPPGAESYDVNVTVSWAQQPWSRPTGGSWLPAPTRADSGAVATTTPTKKLRLRDAMPTPSFVYNATAERRRVELLAKYCPVTHDDLEKGFAWYYLTPPCYELLRPYCNPDIDGPEPMGLPKVPIECRPAAVMGW